MLKNKFLTFTIFCFVSVVMSLKYDKLFSFFDLILIIFILRLIKAGDHKDMFVYIITAGVFFDYLYQAYFGVGFLIFYTVFIIQLLFHKFSNLNEENILILFVTISVIAYKAYLAVITNEYLNIHLFKSIFSIILNITIIYFICKQKLIENMR